MASRRGPSCTCSTGCARPAGKDEATEPPRTAFPGPATRHLPLNRRSRFKFVEPASRLKSLDPSRSGSSSGPAETAAQRRDRGLLVLVVRKQEKFGSWRNSLSANASRLRTADMTRTLELLQPLQPCSTRLRGIAPSVHRPPMRGFSPISGASVDQHNPPGSPGSRPGEIQWYIAVWTWPWVDGSAVVGGMYAVRRSPRRGRYFLFDIARAARQDHPRQDPQRQDLQR